jgi:hypothetical protein
MRQLPTGTVTFLFTDIELDETAPGARGRLRRGACGASARAARGLRGSRWRRGRHSLGRSLASCLES